MRVIVFTATVGETDTLRAPDVVDPAARYLCFSDHGAVPPPYELVEVPRANDPRLASRRIKVLADHPALADADATLWHDASYRLLRDIEWVRRRMRLAPMAALPHPRRRRTEDEALILARYGYVTVEEGLALVARYREEGFAADILHAGGLLARRSTPQVAAFNRRWWAEVELWHGRDQASFDYAAWASRVTVGQLKGTIRSNVYAGWRADEKEAVSA